MVRTVSGARTQLLSQLEIYLVVPGPRAWLGYAVLVELSCPPETARARTVELLLVGPRCWCTHSARCDDGRQCQRTAGAGSLADVRGDLDSPCWMPWWRQYDGLPRRPVLVGRSGLGLVVATLFLFLCAGRSYPGYTARPGSRLVGILARDGFRRAAGSRRSSVRCLE